MSGQKLLPYGKNNIYFKMDGKTTHDSQCSKSHVLTKLIGLILDIESFEKMCHSKRFVAVRTTEKNMVTIGVDQSLSNSSMYEHRFL